MKRVLIFSDWFAPGYRAGGPISSIKNFIEHLGKELQIFIITSDRDINQTVPYDGIVCNQWVKLEGAQVFYCSPGFLNYLRAIKAARKLTPDGIYLNSMFSLWFTILPLLLHRISFLTGKVLLAPRGMLKPSALSFKRTKKLFFIKMLRLTGIPKGIIFQATNAEELQEIKSQFKSAPAVVLSNLPPAIPLQQVHLHKAAGSINLLFLGRVHPIKNVALAIDCLRGISGRVAFTIVGPIEDALYFQQLEQMCQLLPPDVSIEFTGEKDPDTIKSYFKSAHLFFLPTKGENYGHAIVEAFIHGVPVLISDQTPWRNLVEMGVGYDLPLENPRRFSAIIQEFVDMNDKDFQEYVNKVRKFAANSFSGEDLIKEYLKFWNQNVHFRP